MRPNNITMTCQELLVEQAREVKAHNPPTRVFGKQTKFAVLLEKVCLYRLPEPCQGIAVVLIGSQASGRPIKTALLPAIRSPRPLPRPELHGTRQLHADLQRSLYHDQDQTPEPRRECANDCNCGRAPCGEYLWDHRVPEGNNIRRTNQKEPQQQRLMIFSA